VLFLVAVSTVCSAAGYCRLEEPLPFSRVTRSLAAVDTVVLHHTALESVGASFATLRRRGLSYHFIVDPEGRIIAGVPVVRAALHASGANRRTIGISMVGGTLPSWTPSEEQWQAVKTLIGTLVRSHAEIRYVVGHGDVRDTNRGEPFGVSFPRLLAELEAEQHVRLRHPAPEEEPLHAFRQAALRLQERPIAPRGAMPVARPPRVEKVTCPGGKAVLYSVPPAFFGEPK
jgi:N-acetyl-anhydromuramyl-L-alanine amidase AmpD